MSDQTHITESAQPFKRNSFDALLPAEVAVKAEEAGVTKARQSTTSLFLLAVLAGAFIALGAVFYTTVVTANGDGLPWGVNRLLGGVAFSLGLMLVLIGGAELFTGDNLMVMAAVSRKVSWARLARIWVCVYLGNLIGAVSTAGLMLLTAQHEMADGAVGRTALNIAAAKCDLRFVEAFTRGIYCNALVCLAVWLCFACRSVTDKVLVIVFPIAAFVAAGFEHCVANMYFIPIGLFIKAAAAPLFWTAVETAPDAFASLTWTNFFLVNLLPVTVGNIIGGAGFVGFIYWMIYRRRCHVRPDDPSIRTGFKG